MALHKYVEYHLVDGKVIPLHRLGDNYRHDQYLAPSYDYSISTQAAGAVAQKLATEHNTRIVSAWGRIDSKYPSHGDSILHIAKCSCGWFGLLHGDPIDAGEEASEHEVSEGADYGDDD